MSRQLKTDDYSEEWNWIVRGGIDLDDSHMIEVVEEGDGICLKPGEEIKIRISYDKKDPPVYWKLSTNSQHFAWTAKEEVD